MEGWTQRLFVTLVLAVVVLLGAFVALGLGVDWRTVALLSITLFVALWAMQLMLEMRRDVRMLKNQALELSGYESEIGRRVDYIASLVERSGGAATDEIAKRVRAVNREYATLSGRLDALEEDVAELVLAGPPKAAPAAKPKPQPPHQIKQTDGRRPAAIIPMPRPKAAPQPKPAPAPAAKIETRPVAERRDEGRAWREAVASDRLAFHLVPISTLPERTPALYEAVMRLREADGSWLEPDEVMARSREHGLASLVERKTLYTAARMLRSVRRMGKEMRLVAPLSAASLADERGFEELRAFLEAAPDLREGLVLEIAQARFRTLASEARQRIGLVSNAGFKLALGELEDDKTDPDVLRQLGFSLVRGPASLLAAGTGHETSLAVTLASHRIELVATGVADEAELLALIERDVTLAQGPVLGTPRLVKPELLQAAAPPAPRAQVQTTETMEAQAS